jgi:hypothetical protein
MHKTLLVMLLVAATFSACGPSGPRVTVPGPTPTPEIMRETGEPLVVVTAPPTITASVATAAPTSTAPPTPTSLAEGLTVRLGTPDPNPNCPEHYPWFFENPAQECADFLLNTWMVLQRFEHGLMVWTQEGGRTYVLLDDGSSFKPYQLVSDPLGLPLPEADPNLVPPEGLYQPVRGFALFWRSLVPGHEWVRASLGWASAPEAAYSGLWQCNTASGDTARCYFAGPRDEIIVLAVGSARYWTYYQTAVR